jgi:hypothetical protein
MDKKYPWRINGSVAKNPMPLILFKREKFANGIVCYFYTSSNLSQNHSFALTSINK